MDESICKRSERGKRRSNALTHVKHLENVENVQNLEKRGVRMKLLRVVAEEDHKLDMD